MDQITHEVRRARWKEVIRSARSVSVLSFLPFFLPLIITSMKIFCFDISLFQLCLIYNRLGPLIIDNSPGGARLIPTPGAMPARRAVRHRPGQDGIVVSSRNIISVLNYKPGITWAFFLDIKLAASDFSGSSRSSYITPHCRRNGPGLRMPS